MNTVLNYVCICTCVIMGGRTESDTSGMPPTWLRGVSQLGGADLCNSLCRRGICSHLCEFGSDDSGFERRVEVEAEMGVILLRLKDMSWYREAGKSPICCIWMT